MLVGQRRWWGGVKAASIIYAPSAVSSQGVGIGQEVGQDEAR